MDKEFDVDRLPPRRNRPLAWLGAVSGVALVLLALGSPPSKPIGEPESQAISIPDHAGRPDPFTTAGIAPLTPVQAGKFTDMQERDSPLPRDDRVLLMTLLFACFSVMAACGFALWNRGWQETAKCTRPKSTP